MDSAQHRQVTWLFFWMLLGMGFEMLSLGLVIPAVSMLMGVKEGATSLMGNLQLDNWFGALSYSKLVYTAMAILLGAYFIKMLFLLFLAWRQVHFVFGMQQSLSFKLFRTYLCQPYVFHLERNSSQLIRNTVNDVNVLVHTGLKSILSLVTELLVLIGIVLLLIIVEPIGAMLVAIVLGGAGFGFNYMTRKNIQYWGQERQLHEGFRIKHLQQGLGGIKDVILLGKEQQFLKNYDYHNSVSAKVSSHQSLVVQIPRLFFEILAITGLVFLVVYMTMQGRTSMEIVPVLGLFAAASFRLMPSMTRIVGAIQNIRFATPVVEELADELALPRRVLFTDNTDQLKLKTSIELESIQYSYPGGERTILKDVSVNINRGSFVGFVGESGAGKSTLIDLILGLIKPDKGRVNVNGIDIHSNLRGWQDQIGYVPQSIFLTDDTLRSNVALGEPLKEIVDERVMSAIRSAQLESFVNSLPNGLDTVVGERGVRLSGGQQQRIGIARALYHNPSVLVLDEATSSLDYKTEADFMDAIGALRTEDKQRTILVVTHRLSTVKDCDKTYEIRDGMIND